MHNTDRKTKSLPISKLLKDKHSSIADLCNKANSIQEINQKLKKCLDPSLHNHFELANIKTDTVTILVNSSTWATRLRYNIPAILSALNKQLNFTSVKTVRIKVKKLIPDISNPTSNKAKKPITLSQNSAQILKDVADNCNDPELRKCFIKLSKNYHH
ncbi:MAG: DUF721 domain-containing protein [Proteobacteria bacterium]|nr:DUF721 domain-containing protein [Pseudomonadota bacterium]NOG60098.1 DUF721 domain-containing protein [Pseudomonadota bacterium]